MTREERTQMYLDFLREEGYVPQLDGDGDIAFKFEGGNYLILLDDNDPEFFRLVYPSFWAIESDTERGLVEHAALEATTQTKVAKVFPVRDDTWATVELFCSPPEAFKPILGRSLSAIRTAVQCFTEIMRAD